MNKLSPFLIVLFGHFLHMQAQTSRQDSYGNEVYRCMFITAKYNANDFDHHKESSSYGLGIKAPSLAYSIPFTL